MATNSEKLKMLKAAGVLPKSARWGKDAAAAALQYENYFSIEKPIKGNWTTKNVSDDAAAVLRQVNIPVITTKRGNQVWFPMGELSNVSIRETKHGVFVKWDSTKRPGPVGKRDNYFEIILKKGGDSFDHIRYAKRLHREDKGYAYGRLREVEFKSASRGVIKGFNTDLQMLNTNPLRAASDEDKSDRLKWDTNLISDGKTERVASITALIRNHTN